MALSCIISEIKRDVGRKSRFFIPNLHSMPPLGGLRRNIAKTFDVVNQNGWSTRRSTKCENTFTRLSLRYDTRTWQTDWQSPHDGLDRAVHSVARQKFNDRQYRKLRWYQGGRDGWPGQHNAAIYFQNSSLRRPATPVCRLLCWQ